MAQKFWNWYICGTSFIGTLGVFYFLLKFYEFVKTGSTSL